MMKLSKRYGLVIDDHCLFAHGLELLLLGELDFDGFEVCDNPISAEGILEENEASFDLIITDFYFPGHDAEKVIRKLRARAPAAKIVCISSSSCSFDERTALDAGADLFLPKHIEPTIMIAMLRSLTDGTMLLPVRTPLSNDRRILSLTPRQIDIVYQIARGCSNKEIARILKLSSETVKTHVSDIYRQTNSSNRVMLVNWARSNGLFMEK